MCACSRHRQLDVCSANSDPPRPDICSIIFPPYKCACKHRAKLLFTPHTHVLVFMPLNQTICPTILYLHNHPSHFSHSPSPLIPQPSLSGASLTLKIDLCSSPLILSSFNILLSTLASSPSNLSIGLGVTASMTKWLSQCGQYSSDSSNSWASFLKAFLHFLQAKVWEALVGVLGKRKEGC